MRKINNLRIFSFMIEKENLQSFFFLNFNFLAFHSILDWNGIINWFSPVNSKKGCWISSSFSRRAAAVWREVSPIWDFSLIEFVSIFFSILFWNFLLVFFQKKNERVTYKLLFDSHQIHLSHDIGIKPDHLLAEVEITNLVLQDNQELNLLQNQWVCLEKLDF